MEEQPEALRLIKHMDDEWQEDWDGRAIRAELRRLHEVNANLLSALVAAVESGLVPVSSAKDGGAVRHSKQVHVADQIRAAIAKAT